MAKNDKKPGKTLPEPLRTLLRAYKMLKKTKPYFGTYADKNSRHESLSFHKKQISTRIENLRFVVSSMYVANELNVQNTPRIHSSNHFKIEKKIKKRKN